MLCCESLYLHAFVTVRDEMSKFTAVRRKMQEFAVVVEIHEIC